MIESVIIKALVENDVDPQMLKTGFLIMDDSSVLMTASQKRYLTSRVSKLTDKSSERGKLLEKLFLNNDRSSLQNLSVPEIKVNPQGVSVNSALGLLKLSKPVLSDDGYQGLFFYEYMCGADCGSGNLVFTKWENEKWHIEHTDNLYVF